MKIVCAPAPATVVTPNDGRLQPPRVIYHPCEPPIWSMKRQYTHLSFTMPVKVKVSAPQAKAPHSK